MNGKIKEYDDYDNLIFEREYLNGKKIKEKEYFKNDKYEYQIEYLNGKKGMEKYII